MNKKYILFLFILSIIELGILTGVFSLVHIGSQDIQTQSISVQPATSIISADGAIRSENEVSLNFQIPGQVVYLPFKEGDKIQQGQLIASLDQRIIEKNLRNAVKNYENQKISYDNVNDFNGNRTLSDTGLSIAARRQLQTAVNTLDQTQLAIDIQQIAKDQSVLISPIRGILLHEDITVPYVNITTLTQFQVADPAAPVFRADVSENNIDFISAGAPAEIQLNGLPGMKFQGIVKKIYPQKITLANGQQAYQVDISCDSLLSNGKLQQTGTALISNSNSQKALLVPDWLILSHNMIWVLQESKPVLKKVIPGKIHGNSIEILNGLAPEDKIISNPESIVNKKYQIL